MRFIIYIIVFILRLLISIGDATIFIFKLPIKIFTKIRFAIKIKRRKKKIIKVFPFPITLKIKYFLSGTIFSFIFIFFPFLTFIFLQELPSPKLLSFRQVPLTTKIYDRNGALLYQIYASQNRTLVPLASIPQDLKDATIAIEDKNFYRNVGFDILAIVRSAIADLSGKPLQGGSTITQQLIKSTLLTPEISLKRKIKEIILSFWAERIYTKDQILEMYFNQVPYGGTAWGVEAAAEVYFGKKVSDLTLAQSAFLAGLPRAPSLYSPYSQNPNLWKKRQKDVILRVNALGFITKEEMLRAQKEELAFLPPQTPIHAPHFVMYVRDLLIKKYGIGAVEKGGLKVITSLDLKLHEMAQKIVTTQVQNDSYSYNLTNGAALITNPKNGYILSMVGSKNYEDENEGNFNVTTALRQPGSIIKVITYSAALSSGFTAATAVSDSPTTFTSPGSLPYSPVNYDGKFRGFLTVRSALANSVNVPAVKTLATIGIPTMVSLGKKMGITTWKDPSEYGLAVTLGAAEVKMLDLATVYGIFANQGLRVDPNPILKVTDYQGTILEEKNDIEKIKVIDPAVAFIISNILADNQARASAFGTNSPLYIPGHFVPVKTGTSNNIRDNWTVGYTKDFVVAVWVGNNDNSPMSGISSGITGAAPIWHSIMVNLLENAPGQEFPMPPNVIKKPCLGRYEYFIIGTENSVNCAFRPSPTPMPRR